MLYFVYSFLLQMLGLVRELERRTVTHTVWNCSETETEKNWHPVTFYYRDARPENIKRIKVRLRYIFLTILRVLVIFILSISILII